MGKSRENSLGIPHMRHCGVIRRNQVMWLLHLSIKTLEAFKNIITFCEKESDLTEKYSYLKSKAAYNSSTGNEKVVQESDDTFLK